MLLPGEIGQGREGDADAAAEEPAVPGALHLPDPLQRLPASGEEGLLAAALQPLDARGEALPASTLYLEGAGKQTPVFILYMISLWLLGPSYMVPSLWVISCITGLVALLGEPGGSPELGGIPPRGWGAPPAPNLPFFPLLSFPGFYFDLLALIAASGPGRPPANPNPPRVPLLGLVSLAGSPCTQPHLWSLCSVLKIQYPGQVDQGSERKE